jgi:UDP-N-acetylglucosamine--N-acetylmuramyl-(pentapeptide) pyrophosphoryl-undecaprenol N-acetylglucosamine transferase
MAARASKTKAQSAVPAGTAPVGTAVLAAGGTGGHLFPAQALAEELVRRGYAVHLMTDRRGREHEGKFPATTIHEIASATLSLDEPWRMPARFLTLVAGYRQARRLLKSVKPAAIVGFGGYPSFPPLAAAAALRIPIVIHEANAVMGRANRVLVRWASAVASSFPSIEQLPEAARGNVVMTGNPVRDAVRQAAGRPYRAPNARENFCVLILGGSQGARIFSDVVPQALAALATHTRRTLKVVQQCRPEDLERVRTAYQDAGIKAELAAFFGNVTRRIAEAHLVIARAGASTVAELAVIGRPAVLVPLPHSLDADQLRNAEAFARSGAGWLLQQADLTPESLASLLTGLRYQELQLDLAATAAREFGRPDAAARLADLVLKVARRAAAAREGEASDGAPAPNAFKETS